MLRIGYKEKLLRGYDQNIAQGVPKEFRRFLLRNCSSFIIILLSGLVRAITTKTYVFEPKTPRLENIFCRFDKLTFCLFILLSHKFFYPFSC